MKNHSNTTAPTTYSLIVRSEEKSLNISETLVYGLLICSSVVSICLAAMQPIELPGTAGSYGAPIVANAGAERTA